MTFTIVCSAFFEFGMVSRFFIGRDSYPCLMFSIFYFLVPVVYTVPTMMRFLRLFIQHQVSLYKAQCFSFQSFYSTTTTTTTTTTATTATTTTITANHWYSMEKSSPLEPQLDALSQGSFQLETRHRLLFKANAFMESHAISTLQSYHSELEMILGNKESFDTLLDFSRRSFCPECVLIFKQVERFKKTTSITKRKHIALHKVQNFLVENSPHELNLPNLSFMREELLFKIQMYDNIPNNLFNEIEMLSLHNLTDLYERLKRSNVKIRELSNEWKKTCLDHAEKHTSKVVMEV
ncbi:hypothetical protein C9374_000671 [Naegleria lovaniensis]|uniref:RGS domain-containing protein n=1 Tax=Naegleria lovaniensis TaxID=51637 RepID=A0AA88GTB7_NAELO|nr:uncharacterized protein C9374_000671 [Naegleria lovaniensis]KAG2388507.1 hypothetical protein C9374_000671 [Naegleria lovaniensis]